MNGVEELTESDLISLDLEAAIAEGGGGGKAAAIAEPQAESTVEAQLKRQAIQIHALEADVVWLKRTIEELKRAQATEETRRAEMGRLMLTNYPHVSQSPGSSNQVGSRRLRSPASSPQASKVQRTAVATSPSGGGSGYDPVTALHTPALAHNAASEIARLTRGDPQARRNFGQRAGCIEGLTALLDKSLPLATRTKATYALSNLCIKDKDNRHRMGRTPGCIEGLVGMLPSQLTPTGPTNTSARAAASALQHLAFLDEENSRLIGTAPTCLTNLVAMLEPELHSSTRARAVAALTELARGDEVNRKKMTEEPHLIPRLVLLLKEGMLDDARRNAAAILGLLAIGDAHNANVIGAEPECFQRLASLLERRNTMEARGQAALTIYHLVKGASENVERATATPFLRDALEAFAALPAKSATSAKYALEHLGLP